MLIVNHVIKSIYKEIIDKYFIEWNDGVIEWDWDTQVARVLNLPLREYTNILKRHNAFVADNNDHYFYNKQDAQAALEELERYLIMERLSSGLPDNFSNLL